MSFTLDLDEVVGIHTSEASFPPFSSSNNDKEYEPSTTTTSTPMNVHDPIVRDHHDHEQPPATSSCYKDLLQSKTNQNLDLLQTKQCLQEVENQNQLLQSQNKQLSHKLHKSNIQHQQSKKALCQSLESIVDRERVVQDVESKWRDRVKHERKEMEEQWKRWKNQVQIEENIRRQIRNEIRVEYEDQMKELMKEVSLKKVSYAVISICVQIINTNVLL